MLPIGFSSTWRRAPTPLVWLPTALVARRPLQWLARFGKSANRAHTEPGFAARRRCTVMWRSGRRTHSRCRLAFKAHRPRPMIARADAAAQSKLDRAGSGLHRVALRRAPRAHRTRETANELKVELPRR